MRLIKQAEDHYHYNQLGGYRAFIERECMRRWQTTPNWNVNMAAPPLVAWVAVASWVWLCDTCNEQFACNAFDPVMFCPNCLNAAHGGRARRLIFPPKQAMAEIEQVLAMRPNPANRNWLPTETVLDLILENEAHGIRSA